MERHGVTLIEPLSLTSKILSGLYIGNWKLILGRDIGWGW